MKILIQKDGGYRRKEVFRAYCRLDQCSKKWHNLLTLSMFTVRLFFEETRWCYLCGEESSFIASMCRRVPERCRHYAIKLNSGLCRRCCRHTCDICSCGTCGCDIDTAVCAGCAIDICGKCRIDCKMCYKQSCDRFYCFQCAPSHTWVNPNRYGATYCHGCQ